MAGDRNLVVLGGGACGMSAALEGQNLGWRVTVLEREPRVGGLCGTVERDGFRFDFGGHRFITRNRAVDSLVKDLVGADLLSRRRSSVVLNQGRRYRYPLELDDVLQKFGLARGGRALASYLAVRGRELFAPAADRTFEDWVTHRFGGDLYDTFFGPYTEKLWGVPAASISADWAAQRISLPSLTDVLLRLCGIHRRGRPRTYARRYHYPRLGIGQIFERCAERIAGGGGAVRTGATVTALVGRGPGSLGRVRAVRFADATGEHELPCDAVVSTLSLPALSRMLGGASTEVGRAADRLRFRAIRLLNIRLSGPPVSEHTWMYVSERQYLPARIQEPRHRSPDMAPAGCTSLMLELPCHVGDSVWTASDAALYDRCLDDLRHLGLPPLRERTLGYFSSFVTEGYPVYHLGYVDDREAVMDHVGRVENLLSCGRQGAFRYIFMDTAMEMGRMAAASLVAGRFSRRQVVELDNEVTYREAQALSA
jgi:protoporphyrinogen oxidase